MLKVGAAGFTVKIVVCHLASSVGMILFAQVFQLVAFGLFSACYGALYRRSDGAGRSSQRTGCFYYDDYADYDFFPALPEAQF